MAKHFVNLVSTRGVLNAQEYNDAVPGAREAALDAINTIRSRWLTNAPHMIDGSLTVVDTGASAAPTKCNTRVRCTPEHLAIFKASWPCHGIPDDVHSIIFEFATNGDLVDVTGSTERRMFADLGDDSGAAVLALSHDVQVQS